MLCVVLDLDHTLVHSQVPLDRRYDAFRVLESTLWAHARPHCGSLLRQLVDHPSVQLCIWTAGTKGYAEDVTNGLCALYGIDREKITVFCRDHAFPWTRDGKTVFLKDTDVVRRFFPHAVDVVLVDDDPIHRRLRSNRGCVVPIDCFRCEVQDDALYSLAIQMNLLVGILGGAVARPTATRPAVVVAEV